MSLLFVEVELMETFNKEITFFIELNRSLLFVEVELMETGNLRLATNADQMSLLFVEVELMETNSFQCIKSFLHKHRPVASIRRSRINGNAMR